ncbi:SGNH/GDSL hydrolase family protein [Planomicrobium okeanokoites]|uniref:SGNH/GDSL hydrolase family protein n=1 Tax=Planomicrobium okeanokoites TaxID=244 RepID=UPI002490D7BE|nr:SGNH/GDSL hydrolase family protein [Planomicrobium okeanokoites]
MKKTAALLLAGTFAISMVNTAAAEVKIPAAYIALGDSLAAGQTPDSQIDAGYADLIAQELGRNQPVALFSKDLAFPGFTTADVLERVEEEETKELLASANIITLSAGANDLLRLVQANPADGSLQFQRIQSDFALNKARKNIADILNRLNEAAPNAGVYVMGYYFAYPHARESQKEGIAEQLEILNRILENEAEKADAIFVSVDDAFGENATSKVPNPGDVHPNLEGYQAMANEFLAEYRSGWTIENRELPQPNPVSFEEILQGQEEQADENPQPAAEGEEPAEGEAEQTADDQSAQLFPSIQSNYLAIRTILPIV